MAGYSGTPLPKKLGIQTGSRVRFLNAPGNFPTLLQPLPADITATEGEADVVVLFVLTQAELLAALEAQIQALAPRGGLWIAWPKKASKVPTDVTEDILRTLILPLGLVDNKVCAIDPTWSGLRFVRRKGA